MERRRRGSFVSAVGMLASAGLLSGCAPLVTWTEPPAAPAAGATPVESVAPAEGEGDDWVVVSFDDREAESDLDPMDELLETELAADQALADADAGWIDGNDVGDGTYELSFVGDDTEEMWMLLEPVFADAPVPWSEVRLYDGFDDPTPRVITPR
ncbi:hypothetical protein [Microbacterium sp. AG1240]|uniref:hypothetical protein n=1 Tax=Microbacterium sp. AG1240 TaxID=2183992 RepID=UPI0011C44995|nr:hypothetical protein [Microbacterium sp. AG1240]